MSNTVDADRVAALAHHVVAEHDPKQVPVEEFLGACYDAGLSWVHFPEGLGGLGASRGLQAVADAVLQGAGGPVPLGLNPMGYGMAAPTVREHAQSDELKKFFLRPLATTEDIWCQLFSEPGAGSDLAGLATSAVRDGDDWASEATGDRHWVLNGQKVWTSLAHKARWGLLLARTDPDAPKHKGLTYFVLDMHAPGVETRPLRQMTGQAEFNEVYMRVHLRAGTVAHRGAQVLRRKPGRGGGAPADGVRRPVRPGGVPSRPWWRARPARRATRSWPPWPTVSAPRRSRWPTTPAPSIRRGSRSPSTPTGSPAPHTG
jgi:alkylation response protein AidB-like acyl-CoA dehydrogenase